MQKGTIDISTTQCAFKTAEISVDTLVFDCLEN